MLLVLWCGKFNMLLGLFCIRYWQVRTTNGHAATVYLGLLLQDVMLPQLSPFWSFASSLYAKIISAIKKSGTIVMMTSISKKSCQMAQQLRQRSTRSIFFLQLHNCAIVLTLFAFRHSSIWQTRKTEIFVMWCRLLLMILIGLLFVVPRLGNSILSASTLEVWRIKCGQVAGAFYCCSTVLTGNLKFSQSPHSLIFRWSELKNMIRETCLIVHNIE